MYNLNWHNYNNRYVVAVAAIGFLYTLVQIPFAMYESCTGKRLIHNSSMPYLDLYGDMVYIFPNTPFLECSLLDFNQNIFSNF